MSVNFWFLFLPSPFPFLENSSASPRLQLRYSQVSSPTPSQSTVVASIWLSKPSINKLHHHTPPILSNPTKTLWSWPWTFCQDWLRDCRVKLSRWSWIAISFHSSIKPCRIPWQKWDRAHLHSWETLPRPASTTSSPTSTSLWTSLPSTSIRSISASATMRLGPLERLVLS